MKLAPTVLALLFVVAPAVAGEEPAPKPPEATDAPADTAKDGAAKADETVRKTTPEAEKAIKRFGDLIHLPMHTGAKAVAVTASADSSMFGGKLEVNPKWTKDAGLVIDIDLPESMRERYGDDGYEMFKSAATMMTREALSPTFEAPSQYALDYNLSHTEANGEVVVQMLPFTERAAAERQTVTYDAEGLVKSRIVVMKIDPETTDAMQQMLIGAELETSFTYEKKGKRSAITKMSWLTPVGEIQVDYEYYTLDSGALLTKKATLVTPFTPEPVEIHFKNYELDGKLVPMTQPTNAPAVTPKKGAGGSKGKASDEDAE